LYKNIVFIKIVQVITSDILLQDLC